MKSGLIWIFANSNNNGHNIWSESWQHVGLRLEYPGLTDKPQEMQTLWLAQRELAMGDLL